MIKCHHQQTLACLSSSGPSLYDESIHAGNVAAKSTSSFSPKVTLAAATTTAVRLTLWRLAGCEHSLACGHQQLRGAALPRSTEAGEGCNKIVWKNIFRLLRANDGTSKTDRGLSERRRVCCCGLFCSRRSEPCQFSFSSRKARQHVGLQHWPDQVRLMTNFVLNFGLITPKARSLTESCRTSHKPEAS